jgi:UDP-glucuronate 4-epimerase
VTGPAGFIGFFLSRRLLERNVVVLGFDNMSPYYDVRLNEARLAQLERLSGFSFIRGDLADGDKVAAAFARFRPSIVGNLAAQPGVRYSLENPRGYYADSNIVGFLHVLEGCRHHEVSHLVFASSSSVYGSATCLGTSRIGQL